MDWIIVDSILQIITGFILIIHKSAHTQGSSNDLLIKGRISCLLSDGLDDVNELGLERGTTHEEAVDVGARRELRGVLGVGRAAVLDADLVSSLLVHVGGDPAADGLQKKTSENNQ